MTGRQSTVAGIGLGCKTSGITSQTGSFVGPNPHINIVAGRRSTRRGKKDQKASPDAVIATEYDSDAAPRRGSIDTLMGVSDVVDEPGVKVSSPESVSDGGTIGDVVAIGLQHVHGWAWHPDTPDKSVDV